MKSKVLSSFVAMGLLSVVACGDSGTGGSGGSSDGGNGGSGAGVTDGGMGGTPVTTNGGNGGGGGTPGDGNDTIATAEAMDENMGAFIGQGELDPADEDVDFFSFTGTAGPWLIFADAKPDDDPFADGYLDVVVTVFDSNGMQIAQNDDPFPRNSQDSSIYTILPSNGTYYVKVEEFCVFAPAGTCPATYFDDLSDLAFGVFALPLDPTENSTVPEATEPNDTVATGAVMEYETTGTAGEYYLSIAYGEWATTPDTDGIAFTVPADLAFGAETRPSATFVFPPPSTDGNGSSLEPGVIEALDSNGIVVSRFDMSAETSDPDRAELNFPVTPGSTYFLRATNGPAAADGGAPFYFAIHGNGGGNPVETAEAGNNNLLTAEALSPATGVDSYFVEGDIGPADLDHFSISVLDAYVSVSCSSARYGSGVQNFEATILKASDGTTLSVASNDTESLTESLLIQDIPTGGETALVVRLEKSGQDATNTGTQYRCGFHFNPMPTMQ